MTLRKRYLTIILQAGIAAYWPAHAAGQSAFKVVPTPNENFNNELFAVSASSPSDIWAVGESTIHFDGTTWTAFPAPMVPGNNTSTLQGVADISPTDAWAVGLTNASSSTGVNQLIEHWDGTQWSLFAGPAFGSTDQPALFGLTAITANDIWAVGDVVNTSNGILSFLFEHWDGTAWTKTTAQDPVSGFLLGASSDATNDVWAVGYSGFLNESSKTLVFHYDGTAWQTVASANTGVADQLNAVVALAPNNVWAVGSSFKVEHSASLTLIEHFDGSSWTVVPSPNVGPVNSNQSNRLFGITALSENDIYAFGSFFAASGSGHQMTLVLHWDGSAWSILPSPNPTTKGGFLSDVLFAGVALSPDTLLIVGSEDEAPHTGTLAVESTTADRTGGSNPR
jgi:hypothetical protein